MTAILTATPTTALLVPPAPMRRRFRGGMWLLGATALALLAGCANTNNKPAVLGFVTPYRIDIVQGNVVTKEQMALLRPGMNRAQIKDILGTPLMASAFHENRWDYLFTIDRPGTPLQRRSVVVHFDGDRMTRVEAPELPTEQDFVASISTAKTKDKPPPLELTEAQRKALPLPLRVEAAPSAAPPAAPRTYPPLER